MLWRVDCIVLGGPRAPRETVVVGKTLEPNLILSTTEETNRKKSRLHLGSRLVWERDEREGVD